MSGDDAAILDLWRLKRGEAEPEDLSGKLAVCMGVATEDFNRYWFAEQTGLPVEGGSHWLSERHPFMGVSLDGRVREGVADWVPLECKHTFSWNKMPEVRQLYYAQCTHAMIVTGTDACYLSVFFGNDRWTYERVSLDHFYADELVEIERQFWDCVQSGEPPCPIPQMAAPAGEASRVVDMSKTPQANMWGSLAAQWQENKSASKKFTEAADGIRKLVEVDVKMAYSNGIVVTRDRRGLSIKEGQ